MWQEGIYTGHVVECGFSETKSGNLQVFVVLKEKEHGQKITWFGSFTSQAAKQITARTLKALGFTGGDLEVLAEGHGLDFEREVEFAVKLETYNGKERPKAHYIDDPNRSPVAKSVSRGEAAKKLKGLSMREFFDEDEEIPF